MEEILIRFQIYLNDKNLITNHDWDYEKLAKQFIKQFKKQNQHDKNTMVENRNRSEG